MPVGIYKHKSGKDASNYKGGGSLLKYFCIDCGNKICYQTWKNGKKKCRSCSHKKYKMPKKQKNKISKALIKNSIVKHHIYGKKDKKIIKLSRSKHQKLHHSAYFYVLEKYYKKGIDNYLKWFDKKYGLKNEKAK